MKKKSIVVTVIVLLVSICGVFFYQSFKPKANMDDIMNETFYKTDDSLDSVSFTKFELTVTHLSQIKPSLTDIGSLGTHETIISSKTKGNQYLIETENKTYIFTKVDSDTIKDEEGNEFSKR